MLMSLYLQKQDYTVRAQQNSMARRLLSMMFVVTLLSGALLLAHTLVQRNTAAQLHVEDTTSPLDPLSTVDMVDADLPQLGNVKAEVATTSQQTEHANPSPTPAQNVNKVTETRSVRPKTSALPGPLIVKTPIPPQTQAKAPDTVATTTLQIPIAETQFALDARKIIERTNIERVKVGLPPLAYNPALAQIASAKAKDMIAKQYFAHVSPSGVDIAMLAKEHNYAYLNIGENLALGNFTSSQHVVTGWMNSPGHRANILNTHFTEIGVSAIEENYEGDLVWFAVQEFGRPQSECPSPDPILNQKILIYNSQLSQLEKSLDNLKAEISAPGIDVETHNAKANDFNTIVALYNSVVPIAKTAIEEYNREADAFNSCIEG